MDAFDHLSQLVAHLRSDQGCDWDRAQTPQSLRKHLIEEAQEVAHAVVHRTDRAVASELGDLLFVSLLLARTYEEAGSFDVSDALRAVHDKMVRRHPHLFSDGPAQSWEALKRAERPTDVTSSLLDDVSDTLSPLWRAEAVTQRAASVGFDWPDVSGVRAKLDEEIRELDEAMAQGDAEAITDELGDVLFTLVNLSRFVSVAPHDALEQATAKFERRFRDVEAQCLAEGTSVSTCDADTLERHWARAKERT